ncbi:MAG: class I SAM-dependent methyltransferase [Devosia sp.]|nr:class I SAM-dependent methyltransferase [Devosia sp.]
MTTEPEIRFEDGAGYERTMGAWSRLAGDVFLDWLRPAPGLRWVDIGCGNGAFTELAIERCAPVAVEGIDPSEQQLAFARQRHAAEVAQFCQGDAMALPFAAGEFDVATMALVIFFVPVPAQGLAEMVRVVRPGGMVSAYAWDMPGGGFPLEPLYIEMRAMDMAPALPPSAEISRLDSLRRLWSDAGLDEVETRMITVERTFDGFEDFWTTAMLSPAVAPRMATMAAADRDRLKDRVRQRVAAEGSGRLVLSARAHAVKGRVPQ